MTCRKFLLSLLILGFGCRLTCAISDELKSFQKACQQVKEELQSIKLSLGVDESETDVRQRRHSIDEFFSGLRKDPTMLDEFEDGDEWYREFRAHEATDDQDAKEWEGFQLENLVGIETLLGDRDEAPQPGERGSSTRDENMDTQAAYSNNWSDDSSGSSSGVNSDNNNGIVHSVFVGGNVGKRDSFRTRKARLRNSKRNNNNNSMHNKIRSIPVSNGNLKERIESRTAYNNHRERARSNRNFNPSDNLNLPYDVYVPGTLGQIGGSLYFSGLSNDQYNTERNDLSHEANYKLSKLEQDEAECRGPQASDSTRNGEKSPDNGDGFNHKDAITPPPKDYEDGGSFLEHASNKNGCNGNSGQHNGNQDGQSNDDQNNSDRYEDHQSHNSHSNCEPIHGGHPKGGQANNGRAHPNGGHLNHGHSSDDQNNNQCGTRRPNSKPPSGPEESRNDSNHRKVTSGCNNANSAFQDRKQYKNTKTGFRNWNRANSQVKREFNPMNEIKLKTSRRLMSKGFGPSLPSYSLEDTQRELKLDHMLRNLEAKDKKRDPSSDLYNLDKLIMGPSDSAPYNLKGLSDTQNGILKTEANGFGDSSIDTSLIRSKRITDNTKQQRKGSPEAQDGADLSNKLRSKRSTQSRTISRTRSGFNEEILKGGARSTSEPANFPKGTRETTFGEMESAAAGQSHSRTKRFVGMVDEVFNSNVNEDMEADDMIEHERVKRSSAALTDSAENASVPKQTTTQFARKHGREKRSVRVVPELGPDFKRANVTVLHKLQKRDAHPTEREFSELRTSKDHRLSPADGERDEIVREDDYDDIGARNKRIATRNFNIGAGMRPHHRSRLDHKDTLTAIESWLGDDGGGHRLVKSTKGDNRNFGKEGEKAAAKPNSNNSISNDHPKEARSGNGTKCAPKAKSPSEVSITTTEVADPDRRLLLTLRDDVLNSSTFTQLENMLKNCKSGGDWTANTENTFDLGLDDKNKVSKNTQPPTPAKPEPTSPPPVQAPKKDDRVKLNITINASVMGDEESNNFVGNGTINVRPGFAEDRERRSSFFPEFDSDDSAFEGFQRRRVRGKEKEDKKKGYKDKDKCGNNSSVRGMELYNQLDSVLSGKASADVVQGVFKSVSQNEKVRVLMPTLKRNKPLPRTNSTEKSLVLLRTRENEASAMQSEDMLAKVMDSINKIIEKQLRTRSCVPLTPDLADFYELILRTLNAQESQRIKREYRMHSLANDFSKAVRAIDPNRVDEKSRVVKKLLKQYDELPQEDQRQASYLRDDLLMDLAYLRRIRTSQEVLQERRKRAVLKNIFRPQSIESAVVQKFEEKYTPAFVKLLKTADLFREMSAEP